MGTTIKTILDNWANDIKKAAEASEEGRLAASSIMSEARSFASKVKDDSTVVRSPSMPETAEPDSAVNVSPSQLSKAPAGKILEDDDGAGVEVDKRKMVGDSIELDNQDLLKAAGSINALANSITQSILAKNAGAKNKYNKQAGNREHMELTPEVINKLASIVGAINNGHGEENMRISKRASVVNFLQKRASQHNHLATARDLIAFGAKMAEQDIMNKLAQELGEGAEDVGVFEDTAGAEDITIGDVADVLAEAVDAGEIAPEEAEEIIVGIVEEAVGSGAEVEGSMDEEVSVEEVIEEVSDMVEEGILDPDTATDIVSGIIDGDGGELAM